MTHKTDYPGPGLGPGPCIRAGIALADTAAAVAGAVKGIAKPSAPKSGSPTKGDPR